LKVKYNRVSTIIQSGNRFSHDEDRYDKVYLDKVSGSIPFKEREYGKELWALVGDERVETLVVEELSRLGRNTGDVIKTLEYLEIHSVNVIIRNLGIQSRPNGKPNPIWKLISSVLSSLYEMELENIKERTAVGRLVYLANGGKLGRPKGSTESNKEFLDKPKNQEIIKLLKKKRTYAEISKLVGCSKNTIRKVKELVKDGE